MQTKQQPGIMRSLFPAIACLLLLALPILGVAISGQPVQRYFEFPPTTQYIEHAPFSPWVFTLMLIGICMVVLPFVAWDLMHAGLDKDKPRTSRAFPSWGWGAVLAGLASWILAWTRMPWCSAVQPHLFTVQWLSYIGVVNALKYRKTGECMLTHRTRYWIMLFVSSAVFWWFFEYLNRFVQNWFYAGVVNISPIQYFLRATLPFSTVLPAVLGTYELLDGGTRLGKGLERFFALRIRRPRLLSAIALTLAVLGLAGIGVWPDYLFPLLWVSPLVILVSLQVMCGLPTLFFPLREGNWRRIYLLAMSALICGFFWEMWNYYSAAKWVYSVPFVHRFQVFEMPILGYAGYLPFGLECAVIGDLIRRWIGCDTFNRDGMSSLQRRIRRFCCSTLLFIVGVSYVPYLWCSRDADRWLDSDNDYPALLASGVAYWLDSDLSRDTFRTGSAQFDGEWLFGTYLMAGFGYGQTALKNPTLKDRHLELMARCIDRLVSPGVRAFDRETWGNDPLETLDGPQAHAAYLGYFNLLLGLHRMLEPDSHYAGLHDKITAALERRIRQSPILLIESYPDEVYPVDNCAVIASIAMHSRATGSNREVFVEDWVKRFRESYISPENGIMIQAVSSIDGRAIDAPRGSGTALGLYFLSFADMQLSRDLYMAARKELGRTIFGFGGVREYPVGSHGGHGDIDSGPVIFGFGLSPTGFLLGGARIHGDHDFFRRLYATAHAWGAPVKKDQRLNFVTGASLGDAIMFAMLTASPLEDRKDG